MAEEGSWLLTNPEAGAPSARERLCEWAWAVKHWWSEITDPVILSSPWLCPTTGRTLRVLWVLAQLFGWSYLIFRQKGWKEELLEGSLRLDFAILILLLLGTLFTTLAQKRESVLGSVCLCLGVMESFQMLAITVSPGDENHHLVIAFVVLCHSNVHPVALLIVVIYCITFAWRWTDMIEEISRRFSDESLKKILHYMDDKERGFLLHNILFEFIMFGGFLWDFTRRVKCVASGCFTNGDPDASPGAERARRDPAGDRVCLVFRQRHDTGVCFPVFSKALAFVLCVLKVFRRFSDETTLQMVSKAMVWWSCYVVVVC